MTNQQTNNGSLEEAIKGLLNEMEAKIDAEFDFEFEHWDNGNYDDSYEYGVEVVKNIPTEKS